MRNFHILLYRYNYGLCLCTLFMYSRFVSASAALVLEDITTAEEVSPDEVSRVPSFMVSKPVLSPTPKPAPLPNEAVYVCYESNYSTRCLIKAFPDEKFPTEMYLFPFHVNFNCLAFLFLFDPQ